MNILFKIIISLFATVLFTSSLYASQNLKFENVLSENFKLITKSSSKTIDPVIKKLLNTNAPIVGDFLKKWKNKKLYFIKKTNSIVSLKEINTNGYELVQFSNKKNLGFFKKAEIKKIKPNSGVRSKISNALIGFQLLSTDVNIRVKGLETLSRKFNPEHLTPLKNALAKETNLKIKKRMSQLLIFGTIQYSQNENEIISSLKSLEGNLSIEARGVISSLLKNKIFVSSQKPNSPNLARIIIPGVTLKNSDGSSLKPSFYSNKKPEITKQEALKLLINGNYIKNYISPSKRDEILKKNIKNKYVENIPVETLKTDVARIKAYNVLVSLGKSPPLMTDQDIDTIINKHFFYAIYDEKSSKVINTAKEVFNSINHKVNFYKYLDLILDGLSLTSIYFLAAIGLAITFGVMRVINMAHGEFIMIGAYTGYVIQLFIPNHTISLLIAFPLAFIITFLAGVGMERLVIRHLYKNPLDTLLATFGISIALQQIAKNIFGTQARPLTSPDWLDGALVINDVLSISLIRIAIFVLGLTFLILLVLVMNKTRLGLETKAVTQNPMMASSMGINPDKINMLTFGFGSGIAGVAGVAIGLFSKVTSELGSEYIVQSFMTVVVGGVGNIWGMLAGATMIGMLQKFIEWFNPSNTLAAQTYMIIFIILFIQFRPKGIIALKGRASED
ncbi:MAG: urea ABC transporter permease subunit UrtB [Alphaproteobacteria bacterium]|nr:urea ABC transporter permease subunit UrtB [Alphaproteobacteria bacterium]